MAGIVSIAIKCTPNESPIKKQISNNHLSPLLLLKSFSHLSPHQNVADKKSIASAYTSVSTALNQKLSENVNAKAPIDELSKIFVSFVKLFFLDIFLRNNVVDQKRKRITNALDTTDKKFTAIAIDSLFEACLLYTSPSPRD